jgi:hypothetical protein
LKDQGHWQMRLDLSFCSCHCTREAQAIADQSCLGLTAPNEQRGHYRPPTQLRKN